MLRLWFENWHAHAVSEAASTRHARTGAMICGYAIRIEMQIRAAIKIAIFWIMFVM